MRLPVSPRRKHGRNYCKVETSLRISNGRWCQWVTNSMMHRSRKVFGTTSRTTVDSLGIRRASSSCETRAVTKATWKVCWSPAPHRPVPRAGAIVSLWLAPLPIPCETGVCELASLPPSHHRHLTVLPPYAGVLVRHQTIMHAIRIARPPFRPRRRATRHISPLTHNPHAGMHGNCRNRRTTASQRARKPTSPP